VARSAASSREAISWGWRSTDWTKKFIFRSASAEGIAARRSRTRREARDCGYLEELLSPAVEQGWRQLWCLAVGFPWSAIGKTA
jgi:hypothetical protein